MIENIKLVWRNRSRWTARGLALPLLATLLAVVGQIASPPAATAAAYGCSYWGAKTVGGWSVPSGQYCVRIPGSGTWIGSVDTSITTPRICNFDVTAEFFDASWNWKRTYVSGHNYGCASNTGAGIWLPYYLSQITGTNTGYMCSTLRVAWQRVTSVCHYIRP